MFIRLEFIKEDDSKLSSQNWVIVHSLRQILHIFRYLVLIILISLQLHQPLWQVINDLVEVKGWVLQLWKRIGLSEAFWQSWCLIRNNNLFFYRKYDLTE